MPDDKYYDWFKQTHKKPIFEFPEIKALGNIQFELLTQANAVSLFGLFANDLSPFVDDRFKDLVSAQNYARFLELCGGYQGKHGSADWLFKLDGRYVGVLHLYDLSRETVCQNNKRAWIGFATSESFRNQGLTTRALRHYLQSIFDYYKQIDFIHAMTMPDNFAAKKLLRKTGFIIDKSERMSEIHKFYILNRPGLS